MHIHAREAQPSDLDDLVRMYRELEAEQTALTEMWPVIDGLAEPAEASLKEILADGDRLVLIGTIDDVAQGFAVVGSGQLLPQADGERVGQIQYIFTTLDARGVGVGEAMITAALAHLRGLGIVRFDAKVSPGHRLAKNFFEAAGFSARSIVMHHRNRAAEGGS